MIGTIGAWGVEVSQKGDHPGFVEALDPRTLLIPERNGNHEWYRTRDEKFGRVLLCRACGKLAPGLSLDPMCAVCRGPIELDRQHCDVCAACDDSEPTPPKTPTESTGGR